MYEELSKIFEKGIILRHHFIDTLMYHNLEDDWVKIPVSCKCSLNK